MYKFMNCIMKKLRLPNVINTLFHFQNRALIFKKMHFYNKAFFLKFWKFAQKRNLRHEKDVLNYITSRNMSRTLRPILRNQSQVSQHKEKNALNVEEILGLILFKCQHLFPACKNILKFHTKASLLGNLVSKQNEGKAEIKEESVENWGGPEAFKLITFIKYDFDEILKKHTSVLVFFSAYWCPHCLRLKKVFGSVALRAKEASLPMLFATFDVTIDPDIADEKGVTGIPTIIYYKDGKYVATYKGERTADNLFEFVKNPPAPSTKITKADI